ncbi:hypothetical protein EP56_02110 [Listeriaceae bacterium FSL A5-0209]|nr:hypothetical protein EP56_02110 [Listeriaceae bacterium FSL A5-0209]
MTQNEKDREFLNFVDDTYFDGRAFSDGGYPPFREEEVAMFDVLRLADRLLTERENRENAEVVYKVFDKGNLNTGFYKDGLYPFFHDITKEKGVWIPVEEANEK